MKQQSLFSPFPAIDALKGKTSEKKPDITGLVRPTSPDTSVEAAESVVEHLGDIQSHVLAWFEKVGRATDQELEAFFKPRYTGSTVRTRRSELVVKGLIRDSGERRKNNRNKNVIVWELRHE